MEKRRLAPTPEEAAEDLIQALSPEGAKFEHGPVSLPEADMALPNAYLLWEKANKSFQENLASKTELDDTKYKFTKDKATAYCFVAAEILREQRQLEKLDRSDPNYSKKFMNFWEKKSRFVNYSNSIGIDFVNFMKSEGLDPTNLSPENAKAEGRKAHENLPSADEIIRELSRHVDDRGDAYNKYLFMVNNYVKAAKLGDSDAMANAERMWKKFDEDMGLNHGTMRTIALEWVKEKAE